LISYIAGWDGEEKGEFWKLCIRREEKRKLLARVLLTSDVLMMIHMLRLSPQNDTNNINAFNKSKRVMIEIFFSKRGKQKFQPKFRTKETTPIPIGVGKHTK